MAMDVFRSHLSHYVIQTRFISLDLLLLHRADEMA